MFAWQVLGTGGLFDARPGLERAAFFAPSALRRALYALGQA
jgi:hypothetical protein